MMIPALVRLALIALVAVTSCKKAAPAEPPPTPTPTTPTPTTPTPTTPTPTTPTTPTPTTPTEPGVQPAPADAATPSCDALSRSKCLASDGCTLELAGNNVYRCRPDQGPCEVGMRQGDKRACEAKAECAFDSGTCYCPCEGAARTLTVDEPQSGCACACGGGAPAMCIEKATIADGCAKLTRSQCLESRRCTLHLVGKGTYECRADNGPCEVGIQQTDQKVCEAQKGCAWKPGDGYCACPGAGKTAVDDDMSGPQGCACGGTGGPPPMCAAK